MIRNVVTAMLFLFSIASAATIRVPQDQATIQSGINAAVDGDTVLVGPGVYYESLAIPKGICLKSEQGPEVTELQPPSPSLTLIEANSPASTQFILDGFRLTGANQSSSVLYVHGPKYIIKNNIFENNFHTNCILLDGPTGKVLTNRINDNSGGECSGVLVEKGDTVEIAYNVIRGNSDSQCPGIKVDGGNGPGRIHHNLLIANSNNTSAHASAINVNGYWRVYNNTVVSNSSDAGTAALWVGNSMIDVRNNLVAFNDNCSGIRGANAAAYNDSWSNEFGNFDNCSLAEGNFELDPRFRDIASYDVSLELNSPCINAGDPGPQYFDPDGTRNDVGALPYAPQQYPIARWVNYGDGSEGNIVHTLTPTVYWSYFDTSSSFQVARELEIGTDLDWAIAEVWQSGVQSSSDTSLGLGDLSLENHHNYYLRLRVHNGIAWGEWSLSHFQVKISRTIRVPAEFPTIQEAIDVAIEDDTVLVAPGNYSQSLTCSKGILLISEGGAANTSISPPSQSSRIIQVNASLSSEFVLKGFTIGGASGTDYAINISGPSFRIEDNHFTNNHQCSNLRITGGTGKVLRNRVWQNSGGGCSGIWVVTGQNVEIAWNELFDNSNSDCSGIRVDGGFNSTIHHNLLYNNSNVSNGFAAAMNVNGAWRVYNNTVSENSSSVFTTALWVGGSVIDVRNNIVTANQNCYGIRGAYSCEYNDAWSNGVSDYFECSLGNGNLQSDPIFLAPLSWDFHLSANSPCLDSGDPDPLYNDPDGSRSDMGAIPFVIPDRVKEVPSEYLTIQEAINAAMDGDTVLVADGTYFERISFLSKALTLASHVLVDGDTNHVGATVIDGDSAWYSGEDLNPVVLIGETAGRCVFAGVTVQNGPLYGLVLEQSDAVIWRSILKGTGLKSTSPNPYVGPWLRDVRLIESGIRLQKGLMHLVHTQVQGSVEGGYEVELIADSSIFSNIDLSEGGSVTLRTCLVDGNIMGIDYNQNLHDCNVAGVSIVFDGSLIADSCIFNELRFSNEAVPVEIRRSLIRGAVAYAANDNWPAAGFYNCTMLDSIYVAFGGVFGLEIDSCILDLPSPIRFTDKWHGVHVRCTNAYCSGDSWFSGSPASPFPLDTNQVFAALPLFCDTAAGDYRIKNSSPCAPANNSCGVLIGAYGIGCENIAPIITSSDSLTHIARTRLAYRPTASDEDGPAMSYSYASLPHWLSQQGDSVIGSPGLNDADTSFVAIVSDGFLADSVVVPVHLVATPLAGAMTVDGNFPAMHVVANMPRLDFDYQDPTSLYPQTAFEIAVGTDNDWQYSEMWNPAPVVSSDTFVVYNGAPLIDGATYWLRLRVANPLGWSNWEELMFRMNSVPGIPQLRLPEDLAIVNTEHPTLIVRNPTDAENDSLLLTFELSADNFASAPFAIEVPVGSDSLTSFWVNFPLNEDLPFWWRVKASDYYEESAYSQVRSFLINAVNSAPAAFHLLSPANQAGTPVPETNPYFAWQKSADIDPGDSVSYTLYLSLDSLFGFVNQVSGISDTNWIPASPLLRAQRYWWKVRALDKSTEATWSDEVFSFKIMKLGDADGNGIVTISDAVFLINYIFGGGPAPSPLMSGDADCNGLVSISDVVYLINYIFAGGAEPCEG